MRSLIVVDSRFGNTEAVAREVAEALEAHGWEAELVAAADVEWPDCGELDLVLVGGPTQQQGLSPAMVTLLSTGRAGASCGVAAAAFDTRYQMAPLLSGSAADRIARRLASFGCRVVVGPESFFVAGREGPLLEGELQRARDWALEVAARVGTRA